MCGGGSFWNAALAVGSPGQNKKLIRKSGEVSYRPLKLNLDTKESQIKSVELKLTMHKLKLGDEQYGDLLQSAKV